MRRDWHVAEMKNAGHAGSGAVVKTDWEVRLTNCGGYELRGVRRASCSTRPGLFRLGELLDMGQHPMVNPVNEHVCPQRPIALRKDFVLVPSPAFEARSSIA